MNKKKLFMKISIVVLIVTIMLSAVTYAWLVWGTNEEDETKIVTNFGTATIFYDAGSSIEGVNLLPTADKENGIVKEITVRTTKDATYKISFNLYLDVVDLGAGLKDASFKYALYQEGKTEAIKEGNFTQSYLDSNLVECESNSTNHIVLVNDERITTTTTKYTLYIWIDGTVDNPESMQGQQFNFKLHADGQNAVLGETLVQHINNLYNNAEKAEVTNNDINYNYATSVSLMNDGFGHGLLNVWEVDEITTSEECYEYYSYENMISMGACTNEDECETLLSMMLQEAGLPSIDVVCESPVMNGNIRYYGANPNNYIDIGDVYEEDWYTYSGEYINSGFSSYSECVTSIENLFPEVWELLKNINCETDYEIAGTSSPEECEIGVSTLLETYECDSFDDACYDKAFNIEKMNGCGTEKLHKAGTPKLYRIIGLFKDVELSDGTKKDLIKVVRNESIGDYSWDQSPEDVNGGYGINQWGESGEYDGADLMKLLNPDHEDEVVGGSLYWNSNSGNCYSWDITNNVADILPCNFTSKGLSSTVHSKIEEVKWNLGGWNDNFVYPNQIYGCERGENVIQNPTDGITRTTVWPGKVALAYPSDYVYAADLNSCSEKLWDYNDSTCTESNWMYTTLTSNGVNSGWFLTPHSSSADDACSVLYDGLVNYGDSVSSNIGVSPVFYLDSELGIVSGDGSEDSPYVVR